MFARLQLKKIKDMKRLSLFGVFILVGQILFAQHVDYGNAPDWQSIEQLSSSPDNKIRLSTIESDAQGNLYFLGTSDGVNDIYGSQTSGDGIFIVKKNSSNEVVWVKVINGASLASSIGKNIAVDPDSEAITLIATKNAPILIDGTEIDADFEAIVFQLDSQGSLVWYREIPSTIVDSIVIDSDQNVYVSGIYQSSFDIDGFSLENPGTGNVYLIKFNNSGITQWLSRAGGTYREYISLLAIDLNDNLYLSGELASRDITFNDQEYPLTEEDGDIMLAKVDIINGDPVWVKFYAGGGTNIRQWSWPTSIVTNKLGEIYICGVNGNGAIFSGITLVNTYDYPYGFFASKFDINGDVLWANTMSESDIGINYNEAEVDEDGNIYLAGRFKSEIDFAGLVNYNNSEFDIFVSRYNKDGTLDWVKATEGSGISSISGMEINNNTLYISGSLTDGELNFDDNNIVTTGNTDGIIIKTDGLGGTVETITAVNEFSENTVNIYPNPVYSELFISNKTNGVSTTVNIFNIHGAEQLMFEVQNNSSIDVSNLNPGIYILKIISGAKIITKKFTRL